VLSYNYWQGQFGGSLAVIGKRIVVNSVPFSVVGVLPRGFLGLDPGLVDDVWLPFSTRALVTPYMFKATDAAAWWLMIGARLKPHVPPAQAQAAAEPVFRRGVTGGASPALKLEDAPHLELISIARGLATLRKHFADPLFLLMVAVGLVLLIACTNVASLTLARMAAREKELAVRCALGAGRWRIFRQLLAESVMLAVAGGLLGILLAYFGARALATFLSANWYFPLELNVHPDVRVLGFAMAIAMLTGVLFGLAPALRSGRINVAPALKESVVSPTGVTASGRRFGLGNALVVVQVALSILILVCASLLVRTVINLATLNVGFDAHNVIIFGLEPELSGYKGERLTSLCRELQQRLGAIPGVASVGYSSVPLLSGSYITQDFYFTGEPQQSAQADVLNVGPNFFETMRIPLLGGRTYNSQDFENASAKKARIAIVNQTFTHRFLGQRNPIGQMIGTDGTKPPNVEIVGVVGDTKYEGLRREIESTVYFPMQAQGGTFEVRTALDPKPLLPSIRDAVKSVDRNLPMYRLMTQTEQIDKAMFQERLVAWLSGAFALLALVVACIGLYGLLSFEVARRTHEVGIRMALGASRSQVLGFVLGRGIRLVTLGVVIGIGMALGLARFLQSLLYGIRPIDPLAYAAGTLLLVAVTLGACYVPARRATRVDPMVALRYE
jgi:predicted permease